MDEELGVIDKNTRVGVGVLSELRVGGYVCDPKEVSSSPVFVPDPVLYVNVPLLDPDLLRNFLLGST